MIRPTEGLKLVKLLLAVPLFVSSYAYAEKQKSQCEPLLEYSTERVVSELKTTPDSNPSRETEIGKQVGAFVSQVSNWLDSLKTHFPSPETSQGHSKSAVQSHPLPGVGDAIATEKMELRVALAGRFPEFLASSFERTEPDRRTEQHFKEFLLLASHRPDAQASQTYKLLMDQSLAEIQAQKAEGALHLRDLGLSLIGSGNRDQGEQILIFLINQHLHFLSLEQLTAFLQSLAEVNEWNLIERIFPHLDKLITDQPKELGYSLLRQYESYGKLTAIGKQRVIEFINQHPVDGVSADGMFDLMKSLQGTKDYVTTSNFVMERPITDYNKSSAEELIKLAPHARALSSLASSLKTDHLALSRAYLSLAAKLYQFSIGAAWRLKQVNVLDVEEQFHVKYDPSKSTQHLYETLLTQPNFSPEYNVSQSFYSGVSTVIGQLVRDPNFFRIGIEQLQKMEGTLSYISLYETLAEQLPADFDPIVLRTFLKDWMKKLTDVGQSLARRKHIEDEHPHNLAAQIKQVPAGASMPSDVFETHLAHQHMSKMIELLLRRSEPELVAYAGTLLNRMSGERKNFFNRYNYVSPTNFFFGNSGGHSIHQINYFDASIFKIGVLVRAGELAPTQAKERLEQAYQIYKQVRLGSHNGNFWQFDESMSALFALARQLVESGDIVHATEILRSMQNSLKEAQDRLNSPSSKSGHDSLDQFEIEDEREQIDFWQQHLDSFLKARLAKAYQGQGNRQLAQSLLKELLLSFESEITNRRMRFNAKSMIVAAKEISLVAEFADLAKRAFELSIEKISLARDQAMLNDSNITFFETSITESKLDDSTKDHLLTLLVKKVTKTDSTSARAGVQTVAALARLANDIIDSKKYPLAELECLRVLNEKTKAMHHSRDGFRNSSDKLGVLEVIFKRIAKNHPSLVDTANFSAIATRIQSPDAKAGLASLMPEQSRAAAKSKPPVASGGLPNLDQIRSKSVDVKSISAQMGEALHAAVAAHDLAKLDAVLAIYGELVYQEVTERRFQEGRAPLQDLVQLKSVGDLFQMVKSRLSSSASLSAEERKILATLLGARNSDEATGKRNLFVYILKLDDVPLEIKRMALEGIVKCKQESGFLAVYYEKNIAAGNEATQRHFFHVIKTLLELDANFPEDNVFPFLVQNSSDGEKFLSRYIEVHGKSVLRTVKAYEHRHDYSKQDFFSAREKDFVNQRDLWQPSLLRESDLVIAYQVSFSWFMKFDEYIQNIRSMYVDRNVDIACHNDYLFTYTADNIESYIRRLVPGFTFTGQERDAIRSQFNQNKLAHPLNDRAQAIALPAERGRISLPELRRACPRLVLTRAQRDRLMIFLNGSEDSRLKTLASVFGDYDQHSSNGPALARTLDKVENDFRRFRSDTAQQKIETPPWFAELPQLVRFMMTRFFVQLPFGEREALMGEYKAQGRPPTNEVGVRRFFELTHMEKVGQYLSTRRDLLPESYRAELERFQEDGVASSFDEVRSTIEGDLKRPLEQVFSQFNQTSIKAGTIGEVYKATTTDGVEVAVKVITPSKRKVLKTMLERLERVADDLERIRDRVQGAFSPVKIFREFATSIHAELDFRNELANSELFREHLPDGVVIPPYRRELIGESVLVQGWAKGVHIREITGTQFAKSTIQRLGSMLVKEITEIGEIHDDIHPGNVRVNPKDGTVELFDFGRRGKLSDNERQHLPQLLMAIRSRSVGQVISHLVAVSENAANYDQQGLSQALSAVLEDQGLKAHAKVDRIFSEAQKAGVEINPGYLVVVKAITTFEGFAQVLDPKFDFEDFIKSYFLRQKVGNMFNLLGGRN